MRWTLAAALFSLVAALSCSGNDSATNGNNLGAEQCRWPSSLDDAGPGGCQAARALVACHDSAGDTCACLSSDPQSCAMCGAAYSNCQDTCAANEYAVVCGSVGPSSGGIAAPPSGCTSKGASAGGTISYCCPCG
jgi:hypothetical protein